MKKLLFLISLCLLSQNCTFAFDCVQRGDFTGFAAPVPVNAQETVSPPIVSSSAPTEPPKTENKPAAANNKPPVPIIIGQPVSQDIVQTQAEIIAEPQPHHPPQENIKTIVNKEISTPSETAQETTEEVLQTTSALMPPVPPQYLETTPDQEKYKLQDKKKLNLRAEKRQRPPIIVEDNLSQPEDNDEIRVNLTRVEFPESKVFTQEELQQLASPLLKHSVTIADIQKVINGITRCYILGDYATSKAYLPPQDISEGVLKIGLFEGTVGKVTINDNRWTKTGYIKNRIDVKEGDLLKISDLEDDIVKFNNNNDVKIRVELTAGEEQGQTDITLNTIDPFPFHIAFMSDNQGRQSIGKARWGSMLTADSLFGHRDRLSLGGYLGHGNRVGFADYNFPLNKYGTRLGASVSAGNISVINGPMRPFNIGGTSQVYSLYLTHPIFDRPGFNLSSYTSGNLKHSTTDISGFKLYDINTFSVTQGFTAKKDTERGIWYTGHYGTAGIKALGGDEDFFKYEGNITRLHDFGKGIIGQFRVSGQYSPDNMLPWMEQFQIGGLSTVRGYSEGLLLGKSGYFTSAEIITPLPFLPKAVGSDKLGYIYPREMLKGALFMDNGMIFPYKAGEAVDSGEFLMSWGVGLRLNIARDLAARFYWGFGLKNRYETDNHFGRFHFELTCAPDVGRLVADRKPSKTKKKRKKKENL